MRWLWVGAGGFGGALARYGIDLWFVPRARGGFPWSTFLINVSGCFVLGVLMALFRYRLSLRPEVQLAITVGFLGAYTTFSTFAFQAMSLDREGARPLAAAYVGASVAVGLVAVYLGNWFGKLAA